MSSKISILCNSTMKIIYNWGLYQHAWPLSTYIMVDFLYQYEVPLCVCLFGSIHRSFTWLFEVVVCVGIGTDPGGGPPLDPNFLIFFCYCIFYFCSCALFQNLRLPYSPINLTSLTQITTIQLKKLIKTI